MVGPLEGQIETQKMVTWLRALGILAVLTALFVAVPAMAGGGGGGGGVKAVTVPATSPALVAGLQLALAAAYVLWRRRR